MTWIIAEGQTEETVVTMEPINPASETEQTVLKDVSMETKTYTSTQADDQEAVIPSYIPFVGSCFLWLIIGFYLIVRFFLNLKLKMELAISRGISPVTFAITSFVPFYGSFKTFMLLIKPNSAIQCEIEELKKRIATLETNTINR
jgi:hypothetical protein